MWVLAQGTWMTDKEPRPKGRVLEEESELAIFVQLAVFVTLVLDVLPDHVLISMLAHRACEVPICPKLPTPELFLHLRATLENLARRQTLEQRYDFCDRVRRNGLNQKVHVIFVCPNLYKLHLITALNF